MTRHVHTARRRTLAITVYILAFFWGFYSTLEQRPGVDLLFALAFGLVMTYLCVVDARVRGKPFAYSFHWLILFTWPVSVPLYLVWTRRWKHLHWAAIMIVAFLMTAMLGTALGTYRLEGL